MKKIGIAVYLKKENRCRVIEYSVCSYQGVRVEIEIEDDGILEVPDGFHFSISSVIRVGRGERKVLG